MKSQSYKIVLVLFLIGFELFFSPFQKVLNRYFPRKFDVSYLLDYAPLDLRDYSKFDTKILDQKFSYLGNGADSVAFLSEDGKFVLKFFQKKKVYSQRYFLKKIEKNFFFFRKKKTFQAMKNYSDVFSKDPSIGGLVAAHFDLSSKHLPQVKILDLEGKSYQVDLNQYPFVLQKKAVEVKHTLSLAKTSGENEKYFQALVELSQKKMRCGFSDKHSRWILHRNYGFVDDSAIQFDLGKVAFSSKFIIADDLRKTACENMVLKSVKKLGRIYFEQFSSILQRNRKNDSQVDFERARNEEN